MNILLMCACPSPANPSHTTSLQDTKHQRRSLRTGAVRESPIFFLGLHENLLPSIYFVDADKVVAKLKGVPYSAMDVANLGMKI